MTALSSTLQAALGRLSALEAQARVPIQRRDPSPVPERMARFMALSEQVHANDRLERTRSPRESVVGVTDRLPPAYDG